MIVPSVPRNKAFLPLVGAAIALAASLGVAVPSGAQQDPTEQREEVRERQSEVAGEVDALEAQSSEIAAQIEELESNVATKQTELAEADRAAAEAQADLEDAEADVAAAHETIAELEQAADDLVTESFMNGPSAVGLDALAADSSGGCLTVRIEYEQAIAIHIDGVRAAVDPDREGHRNLGELESWRVPRTVRGPIAACKRALTSSGQPVRIPCQRAPPGASRMSIVT